MTPACEPLLHTHDKGEHSCPGKYMGAQNIPGTKEGRLQAFRSEKEGGHGDGSPDEPEEWPPGLCTTAGDQVLR